MNAFESEFARRLASRLKENEQVYLEMISLGEPQTFESYKRVVGYLQAIRDMIAVCHEIEKDMLGHSSEPRG